MNRWVYLHFPHLLLDYQLALQPPEQSRYPHALLESHAARRTLVQANQTALQAGIKLGMADVLASTLAPNLRVHSYSQAQEKRVITQLAQVIYQDIAQIVLYPPQGLLCEVRSLVRLRGGYDAVVARLRSRVEQWPLRYCLSSGYSPLVAKLLAEAASPIISHDREAVQQAIAALPITYSGLAAVHIEKLYNVGFTSVGDLLKRPRAEIGVRFGRAVMNYMAELSGDFKPPQAFYHPPDKFDEKVELTSEVSSWGQLLFPLKRLLQQAESFLQSHQWSTRALVIRAHHRQGPATQVPIQFAHAVWQQNDLLQLCQLHLERQQLRQPVLALSIGLQRPESRQAKSTELLAGAPSADDQLSALVSRLQARLGEQSVQSVCYNDDWRPERQGRIQPWQQGQKQQPLKQQRPCWLLPQVQPIDRQQWQLQWGPERIVSGWWDAQPIRRDYYIAVDKAQRQGWIFHSQQGWYLHGWFS
ncbi:Y-family DNA polymerase [Pseudidiomarina woesei]|uniref:Nucleotidyltransferase/DNA polymerase involved in DNA repair n=1 Tax=Pseudidiomarina woesei TaxID=1381080 RepID=A0A0K6HDF7_9GAMM|nr:DNA polymerase Y family protein [Pseudidiomarina woesei]CUA88821.1 Nucleotidyltransferase/DNA polymerase involved in DNA repair [Pseudidiomarina woesei]